MTTKWCQECDEMVDAFCDNSNEVHLSEWIIGDKPPHTSFYCYGPFFTSSPPELPEGWENQIEEPGSDELFVMNVRARQLLDELVG